MAKICNIEFENSKEIYKFDKVARQANGSVLCSIGDTVMLASVACETNKSADEMFLPLTVQYIEKTYASAKINGGFFKRESRPGDFETLTSRIIDRSLRPLFPSGFSYPTTVTVMVLSVDDQADLQTMAVNAASAALYVSDLPIAKPVCAVRVGKIDGKLVLNPTATQLPTSVINLFLSGVSDELICLEMASNATATDGQHHTNEIVEEELLEAITVGLDGIKTKSAMYQEQFEAVAKTPLQLKLKEDKIDETVLNYIDTNYRQDIKDAVVFLCKSERANELNIVIDKVKKDGFVVKSNTDENIVENMVVSIKRQVVRDMILHDDIRADGRACDEIRPITVETNILPRAHGSCLFTRGQTQSLAVVTIAGAKDAQMYETITSKTPLYEKFMLHYNFPGFSVGEAKPIMGVSRRELGHGNLGKRAILPTIDMAYDDTIRVVSEILESNGSSSMATVCAGSMAMLACNLPISSLTAGVAMGAVVENGKAKVLTDITGLEDHDGDIDFKIAGTKHGITAMQMDIKLGGLEYKLLTEALLQAKTAREQILNIMENARQDIVPSSTLPVACKFDIEPSKIMVVIGKGGATIKKIIEDFEVSIDIDRETGTIKLKADNQQSIDDTKAFITDLLGSQKPRPDFTKEYKVDDVFTGKIERLVDFGAFVSMPNGGDGLLHISKIAHRRIHNIHDVLTEGEMVEVVITKLSKDKIELTKKNLL